MPMLGANTQQSIEIPSSIKENIYPPYSPNAPRPLLILVCTSSWKCGRPYSPPQTLHHVYIATSTLLLSCSKQYKIVCLLDIKSLISLWLPREVCEASTFLYTGVNIWSHKSKQINNATNQLNIIGITLCYAITDCTYKYVRNGPPVAYIYTSICPRFVLHCAWEKNELSHYANIFVLCVGLRKNHPTPDGIVRRFWTTTIGEMCERFDTETKNVL